MKYFIFFFFLLVSYPLSTLAGDTDAALTRTLESAGFNGEQVTRVQSIIETARQQGLPAEAVSGKAYEGLAKHVEPDRIVRAMEQVTSRYEYSYKMARKLTEERGQIVALGNTMTSGIAAGLTRQDTEKIVDSLQSRSGQMNSNALYQLAEETMLTARDLSRQGVSSQATEEVVSKAVQKGFAAQEMRTMRSAFSKQGVQGNRDSLARDYGIAIERGVKASDLSGQGAGARGIDGHGSGPGQESGAGSSGGDDSSSSGGSDNSGGGSSGGSDSGGSGGSDGAGGGSGGDSGGSGNGGGRH